jgi:uncharacterized NAD-dependent epimerase/dehydratase family protein
MVMRLSIAKARLTPRTAKRPTAWFGSAAGIVIVAVVDSRYAGRDAGDVLDGKIVGIPVVDAIETAMHAAEHAGAPATHLVIGIAPTVDGWIKSPAGM